MGCRQQDAQCTGGGGPISVNGIFLFRDLHEEHQSGCDAYVCTQKLGMAVALLCELRKESYSAERVS